MQAMNPLCILGALFVFVLIDASPAPQPQGNQQQNEPQKHKLVKKTDNEKIPEPPAPVVKCKNKLTPEQVAERKAKAAKFVAEMNAKSGGTVQFQVNNKFCEMDDAMVGAMMGAKEEPQKGQQYGGKVGKPVDLQAVHPEGCEPGLQNLGEVDPVLVHGDAARSKRQTLTCTNYGFDARLKWPACKDIINNVRDQSACGDCWAVNTASAFTDRICIGYAKQNVPVDPNEPDMYVSALDIMQCSGGSSDGDSCHGGYLNKAWKYLTTAGAVSGHNYTFGGCRPYPFPITAEADGELSYTDTCSAGCTNPNFNEYTYQSDKWWATDYNSLALASWSPSNSLENAMINAIYANGSISASILVYYDFEHYSTGIYTRQTDQICSNAASLSECGHVVRLIGYGTYNCSDGSSTKYWLGVNSWNTDWGKMGGLFQIRRGTNELTIEQRNVAWGTPNV